MGKPVAALAQTAPHDRDGSPDGVNRHAMRNMLAAARAYPDDPVFREKARWLLQHYSRQLSGELIALLLPLRE